MNYFSRNRIVLWILSGLLLITLSVLGTMIYYNYRDSKMRQPAKSFISAQQFLRAELGLNAGQMRQIESINISCMGNCRNIMMDLRGKRQKLLEELSKEQSDTTELKKIVSEIGEMQAELLYSTVGQYLSIKKVCSSGQKEQLSNLYFEIFGFQKGEAGKGKQYRHRHGREGNPAGQGN